MMWMSNLPSVRVAEEYFNKHFLPKRTRDFNAEENYLKTHGEKRIFFRRLLPNETCGAAEVTGEPFPVFTAGLATFSTFGKGIGIYFLQLVVLTSVSLLGGLLMMLASNEYRQSNYGLTKSDTNDQFLLISAACKPFVRINVTMGCSSSDSQCTIDLRENCELPTYAAYADLAMSLLFAVAIFCSRIFEKRIEKDLDEAIQTVQDYSVVVQDPNTDADDPDEWYEFFSRFGKVRYVTVVRNNEKLLSIITQKHKIEKKMLRFQRRHDLKSHRYTILAQKFEKLNVELIHAIKSSYDVCRVFITFEFEEHQRLCLKSLEVPDFAAYFDILDKSQGRKMFRNVNVLNVEEPPETDNVLWSNLPFSANNQGVRQCVSWLVSFGVLVASWYLIKETKAISSAFLAIVIGIVDSMLPTIFEALTAFTKPQSQSQFESSLQIKLFSARLMLSTILPYVQTPWNQVLDQEFIRQISIVQVATCFTAPVVAFFDPSGYVKRSIVAPLISDSQEELNAKWTGADWSLAEKYTGIAKILFVSMYYSLLTPYSILLAFIAFLLTFLIDRYLLLRKWKRTSMLDAEVAVRLRQQALLAIAAHMYVTLRFIYSWPMDQAYFNPKYGQYEKVSKHPTISPFGLYDNQPWQTDEQQQALFIYKVGFYLIVLAVVISWVVIPGYQKLHRLFCFELNIVGETQGIGFSDLNQISVYEPLIEDRDATYLCSYTKEMLIQHRPPLMQADPLEPIDLSFYIPDEKQKYVLSVVKYYGDDAIELGIVDHDDQEVNGELELGSRGPGKLRRGYSIQTTSDGVLMRVPEQTNPQLYPELFSKISPKVIELVGVMDAVSESKMDDSKNKVALSSSSSRAAFSRQRVQHKGKLDNNKPPQLVVSAPSKQFTAKPLYQELYGISSSSSSEGDEDIEKFITRMSRTAQPQSVNNNIKPVSKPSSDLNTSTVMPKLKRSDSPPHGNFRKRMS